MANEIRFDNADGYEQYMGSWSQLVGEQFIDWTAPKPGWRWLDVGCGSGAFTEMLLQRCEPKTVHGIDPSAPQVAYARERLPAIASQLLVGDAMALPFSENSFDAAVMPLVIFFVPDAARGVSEMARVVSTGGLVAAYAWDLLGKAHPYAALLNEMTELGMEVPSPPNPEVSTLEALRSLWTAAGLEAVEVRTIEVQRTFANFDAYWQVVFRGPSVGPTLAAMAPDDLARLEQRLRPRIMSDAAGRISSSARANAVMGRVPNSKVK